MRKSYKKRANMYRKSKWHPYYKATAPAVAYIAGKVARKVVKHYVNTEFKHYDMDDINLDIESDSTNGQCIHINPIPGGDSSEERNGDQVKTVSVRVQGHVRANAQQGNEVKVMLCLKSENQDATNPAFSNFYDVTASDGGALNASNLVNANRFLSRTSNLKVLKTWRRSIDPVKQRSYHFDLFHEFKNGNINRYGEGDTTGTIGNTRKGALFLIYISDQDTDYFPTLKYVSRVRYIDN